MISMADAENSAPVPRLDLDFQGWLAELGHDPVWCFHEPGAAQAVPPAKATEFLKDVARQAPVAPAAVTVPSQPPPASIAVRPPRVPVGADSWAALEAEIRSCQACGLCERRKQAVPGVGDREASWLLIGEGPGAEEDERGEPFVGQAGRLLDAMLAAIGLRRGEDVYIANAVKCRPPGNRTPEAAEMAACKPFLNRQIELIQPRLILLLGRAAVHTVLDNDRSLASLRGRRHEYQGIPVVVTYHPAYLLRNLTDKSKAWEDLLHARRVMRELGPS